MEIKIEKKQLFLLSAAAFVLVVFFELQSINSRDEWVCQDGKWKAKGNPADPQPVFDCKKTVDLKIAYDVYCEKDGDCACGGHVSKNTCLVGNKRYIDPLNKCEKLCGNDIKLQCVKNQCKRVK